MFLAFNQRLTARQFLFTLGLFMFATSFGFSQTCNAELAVEKNRNSKSVSEKGAIYKMVLTNNSSRAESFSIKTTHLKTSCANKHFKQSVPNANLDLVVLATDRLSEVPSKIALEPGQSYKFSIKVSSNKTTPINSWGCIEVNAIADSCKASAASTVLKSYVPDPEAN